MKYAALAAIVAILALAGCGGKSRSNLARSRGGA